MKPIFDYLDYRLFLRDWFEHKKQMMPAFSFRLFADKAGFKAKSFIALVMSGKANLSEHSAAALVRAMGLEAREGTFFLTLVQLNQATTPELREQYFNQLARSCTHSRARTIRESEYEFYATWYHNTIRELVTLLDFKDDYELLGSLLHPPISASAARKSVTLLVKLDLLRKNRQGRYEQTDTVLQTGDDICSVAITRFHHQSLGLAQEALSRFAIEQREVSAVVGGMSDACFEEVKKEIQLFRKKIIALISNDAQPAQQVYHINFQLFPTTSRSDHA
jgi:uncharacterized protein (TIGR02147 family)